MKKINLLSIPILCCALCVQLWGRPEEIRTTPGQPEFLVFWRVHSAGIEQNLLSTTAYLEIENISLAPLDKAIFYAEYFDAGGRLCFSSLFSQEKNPIEKGPLEAGKVRKFYSSSTGLYPTSEPKQAIVYVLQQATSGQPESLRKWAVAVRAPALLGGSTVSDQVQLKLDVAQLTAAAKRSPVLDLMLAEFPVSEKGSVGPVRVLNSADKAVEEWFRDLVAKQKTFYPATIDGVPRTDKALVLVRAVLSDKADDQRSTSPPDQSEWIRAFARQTAGAELPPITEFLLRLPPNSVINLHDNKETELPRLPPGVFTLTLLADWSEPAVVWSSDSSLPGRRRMTY